MNEGTILFFLAGILIAQYHPKHLSVKIHFPVLQVDKAFIFPSYPS